VKQENFVRTERFYGSFSRSFNVGDVDPSTVNASFKVCKKKKKKKIHPVSLSSI
jgi:HSP20 family molecular chaperone IbpA